MSLPDPHVTLLALAEREQTLVVAGEWEDLAALDAVRRELLAELPEVPPTQAARDQIARTALVQAATTELLAARVDELRDALGHVAQGRSAVQAYGGPRLQATPRVDLAG
ncbi:MAG TPA: flagellar protein FliT [Solirubrobacteraceae bacterium]|nr:flagellar protein FliT [Solirubrobacteraceae bacterium]